MYSRAPLPTDSSKLKSPTPGASITDQDLKKPDYQRTPETRQNKRKRTSDSPPFPNRFTGLPLDSAGDDKINKNKKKESKPPPLILYGITDINKLLEEMDQALDRSEYLIKMITKEQLRITCSTAESYCKLMTLVRAKKLIGHTFTRKEDKCYRIVVKNLHYTTPHDAIKEAIENTGNTVRGEIINARVGPEKKTKLHFLCQCGTRTK